MLRTSSSLLRASTGLRSNQRISRPWRLAERHQVIDAQRERALADALRPRARAPDIRCARSPGASGSADARTAARSSPSATAARESPPAAGPSKTETKARAACARRRRPPCCRLARARARRSGRGTSSASRWNTLRDRARALPRDGMRRPLSIMLRYDTEGAVRASICDAARRQLFQRDAVLLSQAAQLRPEEMAGPGNASMAARCENAPCETVEQHGL